MNTHLTVKQRDKILSVLRFYSDPSIYSGIIWDKLVFHEHTLQSDYSNVGDEQAPGRRARDFLRDFGDA